MPWSYNIDPAEIGSNSYSSEKRNGCTHRLEHHLHIQRKDQNLNKWKRVKYQNHQNIPTFPKIELLETILKRGLKASFRSLQIQTFMWQEHRLMGHLRDVNRWFYGADFSLRARDRSSWKCQFFNTSTENRWKSRLDTRPKAMEEGIAGARETLPNVPWVPFNASAGVILRAQEIKIYRRSVQESLKGGSGGVHLSWCSLTYVLRALPWAWKRELFVVQS